MEIGLDFTAEPKGCTRVELAHIRFIDEAARGNHEGSWSRILGTLDTVG